MEVFKDFFEMNRNGLFINVNMSKYIQEVEIEDRVNEQVKLYAQSLINHYLEETLSLMD